MLHITHVTRDVHVLYDFINLSLNGHLFEVICHLQYTTCIIYLLVHIFQQCSLFYHFKDFV